MVGGDGLNEALGGAGGAEGLGEGLAAFRGLAGVLDDDGVTGEDAGDDDVDRDEEWVVPGGDVEDDAEGLVADVALEAFLFGEGRRRGFPRRCSSCGGRARLCR